LNEVALRTVGQALEWAREELRSSGAGSLEAQVLLSHLLQQSRPWVLAHPEVDLAASQADTYRRQIRSCAAGLPLAYLTGHQEFFGLEFEVSPAVLIPRPETELLVERAQAWIEAEAREPRRSLSRLQVVDVGTGSGCIAVSLAAGRKTLRVVAGDLSREALKVAGRNVLRHHVADRVALVQMDLLTPLRGPLGLVCANLPYVPSQELAAWPTSQFEPRLARDGGEDGLRPITRLLGQALTRLGPGSLALVEIEASQGPAVETLARSLFPSARIGILPDLAGHGRLLEVQA
jgi:release factor glutamine methyltransferase